MDSVTIQRNSFCQRLTNSLCGVFVGIAIFVGSVIMLGWNEFNYVRNVDVLLYVRQKAVETGCGASPSLNGEPVWVSCPTTRLHDFSKELDAVAPLFGATTAERKAALSGAWVQVSSEILQWTETENCRTKKDGTGGEKKICSYSVSKSWVSKEVDSSAFKCWNTIDGCRTPSGQRPQNVGSIPGVINQKLVAQDDEVVIGSYGLNTDLTSQLSSSASLTENLVPQATIPGVVNSRPCARVSSDASGSYVIWSQQSTLETWPVQYSCPYVDMSSAKVGDVRTKFVKSSLRLGQTLSAVSQQEASPSDPKTASLRPWDTHKCGTMQVVNWLYQGSLTLGGFLDLKASENTSLTWLLRFVGWLLMLLGLHLITAPLALAPEAVPCIGNLIGEVVGCALCCINLGISASFSLVVIGAAWVLARPLVGIAIFAVAAGILALAFWSRSCFKKGARSPQVNPGPLLGPTAAVPAAPQQFQVVVPEGCTPGTQLRTQAPDGREVIVTVPAGVLPGQAFLAAVPAAM